MNNDNGDAYGGKLRILPELKQMMARIDELMGKVEIHHRPLAPMLKVFRDTAQSYLKKPDQFGTIHVTVTSTEDDYVWEDSWRGTLDGFEKLHDCMVSAGIESKGVNVFQAKYLSDSHLHLEYELVFVPDSQLEGVLLIDSLENAALVYQDIKDDVLVSFGLDLDEEEDV
ncbi:hypothetical protein COO91_01957 [Nostoc flagelliforme CCNUN1]|uniref:Uncharacterized protein n=1 Tax=Nostoc flagelliforme CCNUN1 TaxID=2038116 RepID=A0A2K8SKX5_9NOSO|nr:hypothetical protein [Nostoc flagelliforme]AUB36058.1 hypothetical protein COO91_01957 [Nostoc flagelliforme CCNUN1]